ncbi:hypothetical protein LCGC14_2878530 [marine sediment metagenome]|uniref:Uncharacterized protein n=1 Tax=marine sediment metagenome TaxID=412755 RepID=A0A0F8Y123_9ZZZZ
MAIETIYKLSLLIGTNPEEYVWVDMYFDVTAIIGFRVGYDTYTETEDEGTYLYTNGDVFLIKNETHITDYLMKRFVDKAKEAPKELPKESDETA